MDMIHKNSSYGTPVRVMDMCCGKGGDLLKWRKANIRHLICADIAETSVEQCRSRYEEMKQRNRRERHHQQIFTAEFIKADCTKVSATSYTNHYVTILSLFKYAGCIRPPKW